MTTVKEILCSYLRDNGYDGIYNDNIECGCAIGDDFVPCDGNPIDCIPGYKRKCGTCANTPTCEDKYSHSCKRYGLFISNWKCTKYTKK